MNPPTLFPRPAPAVQDAKPSAGECGRVLQGNLPALTKLSAAQVEKAINADIEASVCEWAQERLREAKRYKSALNGFGVGYKIHYLDQYLVSMEVLTATISTLQAHPAQEVITFNYKLDDGMRIELSDVFYPYEFTLRNLLAAVGGPTEYADWTDWEPEPVKFDAFLIDDHGVVFVFAPCRLDACIAGFTSIVAPYSKLTGLIDPRGVAEPYL